MLNKGVYAFIKIFSIAFLFAIICLSVFGILNIKYAMPIGAISLMAVLVYAILRYSSFCRKWIWVFLIGIGVAIRLWYALTTKIPVFVDQLVCLNAAKSTVLGDFAWTQDGYFQRWAFQIPLVLYEALVLRIFGTVRWLYIFNGMFSIATCFLIYLIINKMYSKDTALIVTAIYSCFPESIYRISCLYNFIIAVMIALVGIYFFASVCKAYSEKEDIKMSKLLRIFLLTGLFLGISNLFRTETVVVLLGVECWIIYTIIANAKKEKLSSLLLRSILCMIVTYVAFKAVNIAVDYSVIHSGISQNGIKNGCKYWYIVCGLTPESHGGYSEKYEYIVYIKDKSEQLKAFRQILKEIFSTQDFFGIVKFFLLKALGMWGVPYNDFIFNESGKWYPFTMHFTMAFNHIIYIIMFLLSTIGALKRKTNDFIMFILVTFIGFFLVYIIKEMSVQYRYYTIVIITLCSASGVDYLINKKGCNIKQYKKKELI